jgi:[acyl-carrier-protein] S-malonyltransferase
MKTGMLFPGQGSQFVGMGRDLYDSFPEARALYKEAGAKLGFDIADLSFSGDLEELTQTHNAQPAILLHSVVVLALAASRGVEPSIVAGHSLGEFSALVAAGFLRPMDALQIVRRRGELMYEAGLERPGIMASVLGMNEKDVEACVQSVGRNGGGVVVVANYNSHAQCVVSGEVDAVERAVAACKDAGAKRVIPLNVSGAFHSPLMAPTVAEFRRCLQSFDHGKLRVPWVSNVTGEVVVDPDQVVDLLAEALSSPVRWIDSMETLAGRAEGPIFEVGPGKVLAGLMKRIVDGAVVSPLGELEALEAL